MAETRNKGDFTLHFHQFVKQFNTYNTIQYSLSVSVVDIYLVCHQVHHHISFLLHWRWQTRDRPLSSIAVLNMIEQKTEINSKSFLLHNVSNVYILKIKFLQHTKEHKKGSIQIGVILLMLVKGVCWKCVCGVACIKHFAECWRCCIIGL